METNTGPWHSRTIQEVAESLGTDLAVGLTTAEAEARLAQYGPNELAEKPRPGFWRLLLEQFDNFIIIILLVSAVVSLLLGEVPEAGAIMAIVILNAVMGVVQESKAEEALAALKKMAALDAHVLRDDHRVVIPARELVPGDVVFLEAGNYVPADLRLIESVNLKIDEASLTGESLAVEKIADVALAETAPLGDRDNSAFTGTTVTYGRGAAIVIATGMQTQMGIIAEMIQSYEPEPTPLQRRLDQLGKWLGWGSLAICGIVFIEALIQDTDLSVLVSQGLMPYLLQTWQQIVELFIIAVSLAIAAVPEGLPAVVTICLALGMREMVQRNALIRRLPAVETLGSATVICSDKTGTLTQNEMMVVRLYVARWRLDVSGEGYQPTGEFTNYGEPADPQDNSEILTLLTGGMLCSDAQLEPSDSEGDGPQYRMVGDPTEGALVVAAAKAGLWRDEVEKKLPRVDEVPFDSERKRMSTVHRVDGSPPRSGGAGGGESGGSEYVAYVKGAPDVMLPLCNAILEGGVEVRLTPGRRQHIENINRDMGRAGLRVLAVARRHLEEVPADASAETIERDLTLIGLMAMTDPARPGVGLAVEKARRAGIRTMMVTGDYPDTARAIAQEIGLLRPNGEVLTGAGLNDLSDEQLAERIEDVDVFARVSPQHKVRIVEALKAQDHVVAMTGDGVNDAPALKRADIGVAMGITGTDVSKETADMVLTDDNYASIVSAVEQGRIIYSNIRKFVYYLISCNMAEIMIIFLATLAGQSRPLTAIQLLWLNLLTDGAPALALGMEKGDPDIMEQPPRPAREPIINRFMVAGTVVQTIAITMVVLVAYFLGLGWEPSNPLLAQTMAFVTLSASELVRAYTARSERASLFRLGIFSNKYMQYAVLLSIVLLLSVVYVPFFRPIFNTVPLGRQEWTIVLPLIFVPAIAAELTKTVVRLRARGNVMRQA
ncbi:MAG: cation-translocating P-type ATPase [Chloroflexota bacterium]|nr:cation-translocating P-type ATPase [Chloroflexota bacterium]